MSVADAGAKAIIYSTNGIYSYGSTYYVLYPTSGDTTDFAFGVVNATVAMTMELPVAGFQDSIPGFPKSSDWSRKVGWECEPWPQR